MESANIEYIPIFFSFHIKYPEKFQGRSAGFERGWRRNANGGNFGGFIQQCHETYSELYPGISSSFAS